MRLKKVFAGALAAAMLVCAVAVPVFAAEEVEQENCLTSSYVQMNIPYADFYKAAGVDNASEIDAVTSATKNKTRAGNLAAGSYHVNADGTDITGVSFPVKVLPAWRPDQAMNIEKRSFTDYIEKLSEASGVVIKDFDTLLAAAEKAGKKVQIDISNGWYLAGFFLGNGCTLTLDENGNQICDFNSEKGLQAAEAIRAICNHPAYTSGDDTVLQGGMGDAICAGISGTWVAAAMKEKLGDNYAAAKLPTFTVDGEQVQMGSFLGCKILGVNTQTQHPVEAMELAEYLTSEEAQIRRYEVRGYGPSNLNAAASEEVSADVALSALAAQSEFGVSQHVLGTFWTPAEAFGAELEAHSTGDLQTMLDQLVEQALAG